MKKHKDPKKVAAGRIGGSVATRAKRRAAKLNGAKGGRPSLLGDRIDKALDRMENAVSTI